MQLNQFPYDYGYQRLENISYKNETNIKNEKYPFGQLKATPKTEVGEWVLMGSAAGAATGFFICCVMCYKGGQDDSGFTAFAVAIFSTILSLIISLVINAVNRSNLNQAVADIDNYTRCFEAEARKMSLKYSESEIVDEITKEIAPSFLSKIKYANRDSNVEKITDFFRIDMRPDNVCWQTGANYSDKRIFDFNIRRCEPLTSPLQQAAVAQAIADKLVREAKNKYSEDASGTVYSLDIIHGYEKREFNISIIYSAANGNYQENRHW